LSAQTLGKEVEAGCFRLAITLGKSVEARIISRLIAAPDREI
jgi:hypothetical protein